MDEPKLSYDGVMLSQETVTMEPAKAAKNIYLDSLAID